MIERPCHVDRHTFVVAPPESTSRKGKTRRTAEKSGERPPKLAQLGYLFGGIDHPEGELTTRNSPTKCRFGRAGSVICQVAFVTLERRKPMPAT